MVSTDRFRSLALSLTGTTEVPHVDRAAFRTTRRIFATLAPTGTSANLFLGPELQGMFTHARPTVFAPLPNRWGHEGWTTVELAVVDEGALKDALVAAHGLAQPATKAKKRASTTKPTR
jgi:hypothetical protein